MSSRKTTSSTSPLPTDPQNTTSVITTLLEPPTISTTTIGKPATGKPILMGKPTTTTTTTGAGAGRGNRRARTGQTTSNRKLTAPDPQSLKPNRDPVTGRWGNHQHLWCKNLEGPGYRECEILEAMKDPNSSDGWKYYTHFIDFNRRMDSWVPGNYLFDVHPEDPSKQLEFRLSTYIPQTEEEKERKRVENKDGKQVEVVEFVEEEYGEGLGMDAQQIRDHEEVTKIKNVSRIQLGRNLIETWYFSPIPREYFHSHETGEALVVDTLYFCEFTLDFFLTEAELARHYQRCPFRHPPGDEIYRDTEAKLAMFEVDGARCKEYARNLCYLAKFFLDHKTLHYDTDPFLFYVLCEMDDQGYHIVGYFSKEKFSEEGFNLACILTLPSYQKRGYGTFLISFSYEISKKEEKVGQPEKPLSDLGQISYKSYWSRALLEDLIKLADSQQQLESISIMDLVFRTSIRVEDIVATLAQLGLLKEKIIENNSSSSSLTTTTAEVLPATAVTRTYSLDISKDALVSALSKMGEPLARVKPELLHWAPLKVDVRRDKWSFKAKVRKTLPGASVGGVGSVVNNNITTTTTTATTSSSVLGGSQSQTMMMQVE
jgi:histone acetyltransferase MYST1